MQVASRPNNEKSINSWYYDTKKIQTLQTKTDIFVHLFRLHSSNYTFTKKIVKSELVNVKYIHFLPIQIH